MTKNWIISTIVLLLFQIIWMNNVGYVIPYIPHIYILLLLIFPFQADTKIYLLYSFATGMILDFLSGTGGLYALTSLSLAGLRQIWLRYFTDKRADKSLKLSQWNPWQWIWRLALWSMLFEFLLYTYDFMSISQALTHGRDILMQSLYTWLFMLVYALLILYKPEQQNRGL